MDLILHIKTNLVTWTRGEDSISQELNKYWNGSKTEDHRDDQEGRGKITSVLLYAEKDLMWNKWIA